MEYCILKRWMLWNGMGLAHGTNLCVRKLGHLQPQTPPMHGNATFRRHAGGSLGTREEMVAQFKWQSHSQR